MQPFRLTCLTAIALTFGAGRVAAAQTAMLVGTVHVFGDSVRRLRDTEVVLDPPGRTSRTDSLGSFRFTGVAPGEYQLRVRSLGFDAASLTIVVADNHEVAVNVAMRPSVRALPTVTIDGRRVSYPARFAEAYARASRSTGFFFTRERIDSLFPLDVTSLLHTLPGVHVNDRTVEFVRCPEGKVQVWVDGNRRTTSRQTSASQELKDIIPSSIQLMEVYGGIARIPAEFLEDACAVIVIWTKSY